MSKTTIGSASLNLAADDRKLNEGLKRASAEIKGFKSQFSSFSSSFTPITAGIGALGAGLGALGIGKFVGDMIAAASRVEDLKMDLQVMLGSAEAAGKLYAKIKKLADVTPLEPNDLAGAAKLLVNVGVAADDVTGTLRTLGDVAGGNAEKFNRLVMIYNKAIGDRRVTGDTLTQLAENQISLDENLAKVLGVNISQIKTLGSQGKISLGDLQRAINDATSEGGRFYKFMEKRSQTFSGLLSTLRGNWEGLLASVGKVAIEEFGLKDEIVRLSALLDGAANNADRLRPIFQTMAPSFKGMADAAFDAAMGFAIAAATLADMIKDADRLGTRLAMFSRGPFAGPLAVIQALTGGKASNDADSTASKIRKIFEEAKKAREEFGKLMQGGSEQSFLVRMFKTGKAQVEAEIRRSASFLGKIYGDAFAAASSDKIKVWKDSLSAKDIERVAALRDEFDPMGKAKRDIEELQRLKRLGGFDGQQGRPGEGAFARAMQKITDELAALTPRLELKTEAAVRDSVEAATAIIDNANRAKFDKPQDKLLNAMIQLKQIAERQEREAKRIVDAIERKQIPGLF